MEYIVKTGETISDAIENSTGSILSWFDFIDLNVFDDWCPELSTGQILVVPYIVNTTIVSELSKNPANNNKPDLTSQISELNAILISVEDQKITFPDIVQDFSDYYTVKESETITDVLLNATGSVINWDQVLKDNLFENWVPDLFQGQQILISQNCKIQNNVLVDILKKPAINRMPNDISIQIQDLWDLLMGKLAYQFSMGDTYEFNLGGSSDADYNFEL